MSLYDTDIVYPSSREAIEWAAEALGADADLRGGLGGSERVFTHRQPATQPDRFIIVRERRDVGGRRRSTTGTQTIPMQVVSECSVSTPNLDRWHEAVQGRGREILTGAPIEIETGDMLLAFFQDTVETPPAFDADTDTMYSLSTYLAVLQPAAVA